MKQPRPESPQGVLGGVQTTMYIGRTTPFASNQPRTSRAVSSQAAPDIVGPGHDHTNGADNCPACARAKAIETGGSGSAVGRLKRDVVSIQSTAAERMQLVADDQARLAEGQDEAIAEGRFDVGGGQTSELSEEERRDVESLKERDREVRAHEQAHIAAAGQYATGGASYTYETGPDGRRYAVAGEVPVDVSPIPGDPRATLDKARTIQRAALAPKDPSSADRAIASRAAQMASQAQRELINASSEATTERTSSSSEEGTTPTTDVPAGTGPTEATLYPNMAPGAPDAKASLRQDDFRLRAYTPAQPTRDPQEAFYRVA
ncbi:MAG: putative metalloprotease CJM1_0395 family protein [Myxococcota bacterium]